MGCFYGFKLHLIINDEGGILAVKLTAGNVNDWKLIPEMAQDLWRDLHGDKGYISKTLNQELADNDVNFVTGVRKKYES